MSKRLAQLDDHLWSLVQPLTFMGTQVGTRTTVIRLPDGKLWIHSPQKRVFVKRWPLRGYRQPRKGLYIASV